MKPRVALVALLLLGGALALWRHPRPPAPSVPSPDPATSAPTPAAAPAHPAPDRAREVPPGDWLRAQSNTWPGATITLPLPGGLTLTATVTRLEFRDREVSVVGGDVTGPEPGTFFVQRQSLPGVAGTHVGVVELPGSRRAFRVEPAAPGGGARWVERAVSDVKCTPFPPPSEPLPQAIIYVRPSDHPTNVPELAHQNGVPVFESLPGATGVIYLDYDGETAAQWGSSLIDCARPAATDAEIKAVWEMVAEDFLPLHVNVTTDLRVYQRAPENSRIHVVITPTTTASPGSGGVAFTGSFNWTGDPVCFAFYATGKSAAEVISHEVGHTMGLSHDGQWVGAVQDEYYDGHGSGATGWAPIMGVGYGQPVTTWSKGEYTNATQLQDDLLILSSDNNNVTYRGDDHGGAATNAAPLDLFPGNTVTNEGVIERNTDADAFHFSLSAAGTLNLSALPVFTNANLALNAELRTLAGALLLTNAPGNTLRASLATNLPAGSYVVTVRGAGRGTNASTGFTAYGSLGYYRLTGTVTSAVLPTRFSVAENSPAGTVVGTVPGGGSPGVALSLVGGNTSNALALASPSGVLTVANPQWINHEFRAQFDLQVQAVSNGVTFATNRVVVTVVDADEAPAVAATNALVLAGTDTNAVLATVTAADPDHYSRVTFAIASDPSGLFRVRADTGELLLAAPLNASTQSVHQVWVSATDPRFPLNPASNLVTFTVVPNNSPTPPGFCSYLVYDNLNGYLLTDLTSSPSFPNAPTAETLRPLAEGVTGRGDNYGSVLRGYLIPTVSGPYALAIASDDYSELWLSTNAATNGMQRIARVDGWTDPRQWTTFSTQISTNRTLTAGQAYYFEARQKEGGGGDNLAVGWRNTNAGIALDVIPGAHLAPYRQNFAPRVATQSFTVFRGALPATALGALQFTDVDAEDLNPAFAILSGNGPGWFAFTSNGTLRVADTNGLAGVPGTNVVLTVRVTDTNLPPLAGTGTVNVVLRDPAALPAVLYQEVWTNMTGDVLSGLTNDTRWPGRPSLLSPVGAFTNSHSGDNYGSRLRLLLTPAVSGAYSFCLASDDHSDLRLGRTATNTTVIASVPGWTNPAEWNKYPSQRSTNLPLVAGTTYYLEARQKEGGGGDHVTVVWTLPGSTNLTPIPAALLSAPDLNHPPTFTNQTLVVAGIPGPGQVMPLSPALDSVMDTLTYQLVSGNVGGTFSLDPQTGALTVITNALVSSGQRSVFELAIRVQDNGCGGRLIPATTGAVVRVQFNGQTQTPYEAWSAVMTPARRGRDQDGDGDGLQNLAEFFLGANPLRPDADGRLSRAGLAATNGATHLTFQFRRRTDYVAAGLAFRVEGTANLAGPWGAAEVTQDGDPVPTGDGLTEEVSFRLNTPVTPAAPRQFLRLRVTEP